MSDSRPTPLPADLNARLAERGTGTDSIGTVIVAGLANLAIAAAKLFAGFISGSAAMMSEAAHSLADTTTEVLLFTALRRGVHPADERHPFGYGKESYVWAFLAALFTFVGGAGFSITHGVHTIRSGEHTGAFMVAYIVLGVSFVIEGVSLTRAVRQVRNSAKEWRVTSARFLLVSPDTTVKAVFLEDSAALVGLLLAGTGLGLSQATGNELWDGLASIAIGLLLLVAATTLARANISLLVGRAATPRIRQMIVEELYGIPIVERIDTLLTMQLGPTEVLVAVKVDFSDKATGAEIEAAAEEAELRLQRRYSGIRYVFLDPTGRRG